MTLSLASSTAAAKVAKVSKSTVVSKRTKSQMHDITSSSPFSLKESGPGLFDPSFPPAPSIAAEAPSIPTVESTIAAIAFSSNPHIREIVPFFACLCGPEHFEEACASKYSEIYVKTSEGYLKHMKLKGDRYVRLKVDKLPGKAVMTTVVEPKEQINFLPAGKVPYEYFEQIVEFFRQVMVLKKSDMEAHAWILWEEKKGYYISVPKQTVGKASVNFTYDDEALPPGAIIVVDLHSHNTMGSFFSGTDNNNDKTGIYYSGVIGKITPKSYEWVMRFNMHDVKRTAPLEEVFDMAVETPKVPTEWLEKVVVQSYASKTYFPKGGNATNDVSRMGKDERSSQERNGSHSFYPTSKTSLWDDLSHAGYDSYFDSKPSSKALVPNAKANAEVSKSTPKHESFLEWQKRMNKNLTDRPSAQEEEFDRIQLDHEKMQDEKRSNIAEYYDNLQALARLNDSKPESGITSLSVEAEIRYLEGQISKHVNSMSDNERQDLGLSQTAEDWLERYHSKRDELIAGSQEVDPMDFSDWSYYRQDIGAKETNEETEEVIREVKGHILADDEQDEIEHHQDYDAIAIEYGKDCADAFEIIDEVITDLEGYDEGLKEIISTAYHLLSENGQASMQTDGIR